MFKKSFEDWRRRRASRESALEVPVVNGWTLFFHPCILDQIANLTAAVVAEREAGKGSRTTRPGTPATANDKVLASVYDLMFETIPSDPTRKEYRQGDTLGTGRSHWLRAKFGAQRFRLFFQHRTDVKIIVYAWVNDQDSLRTYNSKTDAYHVFAGMLNKGNPPNTWDKLLAACQTQEASQRTAALAPPPRKR